jgi:DNA-binding transcriptional regulator YiaG
MATKTTPGEKIKVARKRAGMTQQKLAEALGCSLRTVQGWETEGRIPFGKWLGPLSRILDVPVGALVD